MQSKFNHPPIGMPTKGTVTLYNGDHLVVEYVNPNGERNSITLDAQHLVLMAVHEQTQAGLVIRPSVGAQFVPGII